jgi:hypothetical protein
MIRRFSAAVLALVAWAFMSDLSACGDKFLLLGRAVGYEQLLKASRPGTVLVYTTATLPEAFRDGKFGLLMEAAGHHESAVNDLQGLERTLATGKVDLVLADSNVSGSIAAVVSKSSSALLVPILTDSPPAQQSEFERRFGCVLRLPAQARKVIDTLDKAMKLKTRRASLRTT